MFQPLLATLALTLPTAPPQQAAEPTVGSFTLDHEVTVPVDPEEAFDLFTGDVSPWWDHTFSEQPHALVIEPRPGGSFFEWFDDEGNGVQHARVTWAQRGERLVFQGPLGLHGLGLDLICSFSFESVDQDEAGTPGKAGTPGNAGTQGVTARPGESTRVKAHIVGVGVIQPGWKEAVDGVWKHFLVERYQPYVEGLAPRPAEEAPVTEEASAEPVSAASPAAHRPRDDGSTLDAPAPAPSQRRRRQL